VGRASGQHPPGVGVGDLALRAVDASAPVASMDRLVVSRYSGGSGSHRLAV